MIKDKLRYNLIQQRKSTSEDFVKHNSKKICETLLNLSEFKNQSHFLFYVSYNGEVHTHDIIKKLLSLSKTVAVPISHPSNHTLTLSKLIQFDDLTPGTYGILEPKKETVSPISIDLIEVIIVPGVGFDEIGHRIGQGGGYYDWLLSHSKALSIALAFEFQIKKEIPTESHDQRVDMIITEKRVISCNSN